uniref:Centromere protein S n=1 Tax=Clastoptera arizonana TaxID=38151 RepID=A0A1B6BZ44_9HEMI
MLQDLYVLIHSKKLKLGAYVEVSRIASIVLEENTIFGKFKIEKDAKELIAELMWKKIKTYSEDLEAFANHANRTTVNAKDVLLLVRRNPKMLDHITKLSEEKIAVKEGKKKREIKVAAQIENIPIELE